MDFNMADIPDRLPCRTVYSDNPNMAEPIDLLIFPRWIVPVVPAGVLVNHALAVKGGCITAVVPAAEARSRFAAREIVELPNHVLIPGLINLHTHAAMSLLRGYGDDLPLMEWLAARIWPAEQKSVSADFVRDGSLLACAEMLAGGITCFNDMYFFPGAAAEAALESGIRASLGMIAIDFPTAYASDSEDYLDKGLAVRDRFKGEARLTFTFAPHAPYTVSDDTLSRISVLAEQLDAPVHIHLHETAHEIEESQAKFGVRPLERLGKAGLLSPRLIAVHAVHLLEGEIETLAKFGCHIAHCPASNLKLASGLPPVHKWLEGGLNLGIGTDGAASNNRLDMFAEMRLAALLAKGVSGNAAILPAHQALEAATLGGARALGLEEHIGSLASGKRADMAAVDLSGFNTQPVFDPVSHLIYAAGREQVSHVWVEGELVARNGQALKLDQSDLRARIAYWSAKLAGK
jgi:5-methylthioadenosine/S-adenosylhomocysteine deaminase